MPFITVIDTVFQGRVASWRDDDDKPCVFETSAEAEEMAADVMHEDDDPDMVVEVVVNEQKIFDPIDGRVYWTRGEEQ
jgi:hypothetical protein